MDNQKDFSDLIDLAIWSCSWQFTWGCRIFNDVNYYDQQEYFDQHHMWWSTPPTKICLSSFVSSLFWRNSPFIVSIFKDDRDFADQRIVSECENKNPTKVKASDRYLVLSTCGKTIASRPISTFVQMDSGDWVFVKTWWSVELCLPTRGQE